MLHSPSFLFKKNQIYKYFKGKILNKILRNSLACCLVKRRVDCYHSQFYLFQKFSQLFFFHKITFVLHLKACIG